MAGEVVEAFLKRFFGVSASISTMRISCDGCIFSFLLQYGFEANHAFLPARGVKSLRSCSGHLLLIPSIRPATGLLSQKSCYEDDKCSQEDLATDIASESWPGREKQYVACRDWGTPVRFLGSTGLWLLSRRLRSLR